MMEYEDALRPDLPLRRIVSGGQTGVDRAALDVAMQLGLEHGGWCPAGRRAEDGEIPARYRLRETPEAEYHFRTERNIQDSDATLILTRGPMRGGTELTYRLTHKHGRPCLVVDLRRPPAAEVLRRWLANQHVAVLNVAGPRESQAPGIAAQAKAWLAQVLRGDQD